MQVELDDHVRVGEAARLLDVHRNRIYQFVWRGELKALSTALGVLVDRSDLERLRLERAARGLPRRRKA